MNIQDHINGILDIAGLKPEDVYAISVKPGHVEFSVWAKNEDGGIATIETAIGNIPLSFTVVASIGAPAEDHIHDHDHDHDHEHGPHTHTHDDVDA